MSVLSRLLRRKKDHASELAWPFAKEAVPIGVLVERLSEREMREAPRDPDRTNSVLISRWFVDVGGWCLGPFETKTEAKSWEPNAEPTLSTLSTLGPWPSEVACPFCGATTHLIPWGHEGDDGFVTGSCERCEARIGQQPVGDPGAGEHPGWISPRAVIDLELFRNGVRLAGGPLDGRFVPRTEVEDQGGIWQTIVPGHGPVRYEPDATGPAGVLAFVEDDAPTLMMTALPPVSPARELHHRPRLLGTVETTMTSLTRAIDLLDDDESFG